MALGLDGEAVSVGREVDTLTHLVGPALVGEGTEEGGGGGGEGGGEDGIGEKGGGRC